MRRLAKRLKKLLSGKRHGAREDRRRLAVELLEKRSLLTTLNLTFEVVNLPGTAPNTTIAAVPIIGASVSATYITPRGQGVSQPATTDPYGKCSFNFPSSGMATPDVSIVITAQGVFVNGQTGKHVAYEVDTYPVKYRRTQPRYAYWESVDISKTSLATVKIDDKHTDLQQSLDRPTRLLTTALCGS